MTFYDIGQLFSQTDNIFYLKQTIAMQPNDVPPRYSGSVCNCFEPFAVDVSSQQNRADLRIADAIYCGEYLRLNVNELALSCVNLRNVRRDVIKLVRVWCSRAAAIAVIARRDMCHPVKCVLPRLIQCVDLVL